MVFTSLHPPLDIPKVNFAKCYLETLKRFWDRKVLIDVGTSQELTGNDVQKYAYKFASLITRNAVHKQDVVALACSNCVEYPVVFLGNALCNVITTTCNPRYTYEETLRQFQLCTPKCVITDLSELEKIQKVAKAVPSIQKIWTVDGIQTTLFELLRNEDGIYFPHDVDTDPIEDVVFLPFSSGTTGVPKGVMLTHYNMTSIHYTDRTSGGVNVGTVCYNILPMFNIYGFSILLSYLMGSKQVIDKRFNVKSTLETIQKYKVSFMPVVPAILKLLIQSDKLKDYDVSSLTKISCAGSALSSSVGTTMMKQTMATVVTAYGMTESLKITSQMKPGLPLNSVGFLRPNARVKIVDPNTRQELKENENGEILVKSPRVTKGYYKSPEATRDAFDEEGWFKTGDLGHINKDGLLFLVDRLKQLIKYKGFQVAPSELEEVLSSHPMVKDVAVIGIKDPTSGEVPKAFVVKADSNLIAKDLHEYVEAKVSKYKYLRGGIEFVKNIPKGSTGKILHRELKESKQKKSNL